MQTISSKWTDEDLLSVLVHANGDFTLAVEAIFHYEATGRPPEELIRFLSERGRHFAGSSPTRRGVRRSCSEGIASGLPSVGLGGGGIRRMSSEGAAVTSYNFVPPSSTNSSVLNERYTYSQGQEQGSNGPSSTGECYAVSEETYVPGGLPTGMIRCPPSKIGQSTSSPTALVNDSTQTQQQQDQNENKTCSERRQKLHNYDKAKVPKSKSRYQHILDMWEMQSGIEASLKDAKNTAENDAEMDDEAVTISYAIKVSKDTFDEACRKQELRNALEKRMMKISLTASLSDPGIKKSEEELMGEALKISLAEPVRKSEEQLIEEARENSLKDFEKLETIMKSEEELLEAAKQKSLRTMSKDEELIDAVKRQSLKDARKDPLWWALEKSLSESLDLDTQRRLTASTHLLSFGDDIFSESSSSVEDSPASRFHSPLIRSELDWMDRKMPALVLPGDQNCGEDQTQHSSRLRSESNCISSSSVEVNHLPSSTLDSSLDESSDLDLMDRKMPARVLPAVPSGDVMSSSSVSNLDVASGLLSLADHVREYDNRSGSVAQHNIQDSIDREVRCLSVKGASFPLINGLYKEEVSESKMFTLRVGLNGDNRTVASIYQTSTQGRKEWVFSIANSKFSPDEKSGMDVILYTASVENCNEDLPSPSATWVGRNALVLGGSPPQVTEL